MRELDDSRQEYIASGNCPALPNIAAGIELREMISGAQGAIGVSSGTATFQPNSELPYHLHNFSEAITVLEGEADVLVEGRWYRLKQLDAMHFPSGIAHSVLNPTQDRLLVHWAFATESPRRELVPDRFPREDRRSIAVSHGPEHSVRFADAETYELAEGAQFTDLFGQRFGAVGICGGYGRFAPGASLPCHIHACDESITIITGKAVCEVMGQRRHLSNCDTAFVPKGRPHRFLNETTEPMAMIWVYASGEPERTILDAGYCTGRLSWFKGDNA